MTAATERVPNGSRVIVLDRGPFRGRLAIVEAKIRYGVGYWVRVEGDRISRTAVELQVVP